MADLVGVPCPTIDEFLNSVRVFQMERRAFTSYQGKEPETTAIAAAVPFEAVDAPFVKSASTASIDLDNPK